MFIKNWDQLLKKPWNQLDFMEKAAVLSSTGGQLAPEDAVKFIDTVVDQSAILKEITIEKFTASSKYIDTIAIATRQFRKAVEATLATTAQSVNFSATLPRRTLTPVEVILAPDISYTWLHENIEREAAENHLMSQVAIAFGNDTVDLAVNGNEDSADNFLLINDGWIQLMTEDADVNDADCTAKTAIDSLDWILSKLPSKYKGLVDQLAFRCSFGFAEKYRKELSQRATAGGDSYLINNPALTFAGIRIKPTYSFPDAYVTLTTDKNLVVGFNKVMTVEKMLQPRKQVIEYTITAKMDPNYAVSELCVLGANIGV